MSETCPVGGPIYRPGGANNHPLKGGKYSDWEGGVRANAFLAGGALPPAAAGRAYDGLFSVADWFATLRAEYASLGAGRRCCAACSEHRVKTTDRRTQ